MAKKKSNLPILLLILGVVMVAVGIKAHFFPPGYDLPQHVVASDTSLEPKDGRRIEIHCNNPKLTRDEARALIAFYKDRAGNGQVGICKPDQDNNYLPWAVWNSGENTKFQDYFFAGNKTE